MVAIDINTDEIARAKELVQRVNEPDIRSLISFQAVKEGVPLDMDPFDIVLLVDSMEHVRDPVAMLNLAYSMTRPGGVCYFSTMGWYHYSASHVGGIIPIPFLTLLFDDKTILDAVRRIVSMPEYRRSMWDSDPPVLRWENVNDLHDRPGEYLNKITVRGLRQAMNKSRFAGGRLRVMGFSWRRHSWMRWLNVLTRIPVIQEAYHSAVFGRLERNGSEL
jgi:SAM-dependent methyltransferase